MVSTSLPTSTPRPGKPVKYDESTEQRIQAMLDGLTLRNGKPASANTRAHVRVTIHKALGDAVDEERLEVNPADRVRAPLKLDPSSIDPFTRDELQVLEAAREIPFYDLIMVAAGTGMREGELLALQCKNVDLGPGAAVVVTRSFDSHRGRRKFKEPKNRKPRRIDLFAMHQRLLADHNRSKGPEDLVWCRADGTPLDATTVSKSFVKSSKALGLRKIRFQDLRHTHATLLLGQGWDGEGPWGVKAVQERLGHQSAKMTLDLYGHFVPGIQAAYIKAQRFRKPSVVSSTLTAGSTQVRAWPLRDT